MVDLFPSFTTSPRSDGDLPLISPIASPLSPLSCASPAAHSLSDGALHRLTATVRVWQRRIHHSTPRGHRCPTCRRSGCHPIVYVRILISIWLICFLVYNVAEIRWGSDTDFANFVPSITLIVCIASCALSPDEAPATVDSDRESLATSLSITSRIADLQLITLPLIPLPKADSSLPGFSRSLRRSPWLIRSLCCPGRGPSTQQPSLQLPGTIR